MRTRRRRRRWPREKPIVRPWPFPKRCSRCRAKILSTAKKAAAWCDNCGRSWLAPGNE